MKCDKKMMLLYAVTDRAWTGNVTLYEQVEQALQNGVTCVQLREKTLDEAAFLTEAIALAKLCKEYDVPLIINDNVDIALKSGAAGVHVGQEDMSLADVRAQVGDKLIIGVSAHNLEEALLAEANGADYLGLGAVFTTITKTNTVPLSYETLKTICNTVTIPTVAIGGINQENVAKLNGSGVDGIAVVSAIFGAENIAEATKTLLKKAQEIRG